MPEAPSAIHSFREVVGTGDIPELGPHRRATAQAEATLRANLEGFFAAKSYSEVQRQLLLCSAILWNDHLEPAHVICQQFESPEAAWLHGIVHRREPDYPNAKYWFRRVGKHPAFGRLAERASPLFKQNPDARNVASAANWDPFAFIDRCEKADTMDRSAGTANMLRQVQACEFEVLWEYLLQQSGSNAA